jgi:CO dehydrogenase/acetyl-CoA synthase alpha subunit
MRVISINEQTPGKKRLATARKYGGTQVGGTVVLTQSCVSAMHVPNALMFELIKTVWHHFLKQR